jgi:argininosuccinate lyase
MWTGRFELKTSELVKQFSESISYDQALYQQDIQGSIAHAEGLAEVGLLTHVELELIRQHLTEISAEITVGSFIFSTDLEDIHMNIESALSKRLPEIGAKLHTARSRNDQVSTDLRLYCREQGHEIIALVEHLQKILLGCAEYYQSVLIPGYTHLQRAQPVSFAHHLLAYIEMFGRDRERFQDAIKRLNYMPLGSGAIAGSTLILPRQSNAERLKFTAPTANSMDAVSDRDFVAELLFVIALLGVHLSRLSEDLILWCSAEFQFVTLSDAHTTGSSLMPQKKNPDVAELTRGKSARHIGNLMAILTLLKGLPMTYNRDLQEDKEPLFDSVGQIKLTLSVFAEMMSALKVNEDICLNAASDPMLLATDLADYLVTKGLPFRLAHEVIGKLVAHCVKNKVHLNQLSLSEYQAYSSLFEFDVFEKLDLQAAMKARVNIGAPSPDNIKKEIQKWKTMLELS